MSRWGGLWPAAMAAAIATAAVMPVASAHASSLDVSPILIDVTSAKGSATSLTLRNRGTAPVNIQLRLFRWRQVGGADVLEPTTDVVASPPFVRLLPGAPYVVRIVRTSKAPVVAEESYRLLIDELPAPQRAEGGSVQLAVRHSIPVFFRSPSASAPDVTWSAAMSGGRLVVGVANRGDRRMRVANLRVVAADGTSATVGNGLAGYALGHAGHGWSLAVSPRFQLAGAHVEYADEQGNRQARLTLAAKPKP